MPHTYHFYASNPATGRRVLKRSYTAPDILHAYLALIFNLARRGKAVQNYKWCVGRSDKTREWTALRRAGHSIEELFAQRTDLTHFVFDGARPYKDVIAWLTYAEREDWK